MKNLIVSFLLWLLGKLGALPQLNTSSDVLFQKVVWALPRIVGLMKRMQSDYGDLSDDEHRMKVVKQLRRDYPEVSSELLHLAVALKDFVD